MEYHIAFLKPSIAAAVLDCSKTIESRLSINRHPARNTSAGDSLIIKAGAGLALATVARIETHESLTPADVDTLRNKFASRVNGNLSLDAYWHSKRQSRFAVFIWITDVRPCFIPASLLPSTQTGWVQNYKPTDVVLSYLRAESSPHLPRLI